MSSAGSPGWSRRSFFKALTLGAAGLALGLRRAEAALDPRPIWKVLSRSAPVLRRSSWANEAPYLPKLYAATPYYMLTVHHQGADTTRVERQEDVARLLRHVAQSHLKRGYGDIGYHAIIDRSGVVWEGRSLRYQGAHVSGHNPGNIGVMLLGNFERQRPSARQLDSLASTVRAFCSALDIAGRRVLGHRDLASTLCPGRYVYPHLPAIRPRA